jgi:hypothetical protein
VSNEARGIGKYGAAFDVIPMAVTVDDITNGNTKAFGKLFLHPGCESCVDRIGEDNSLGSDHEEREIVIASRSIDVAFDVDDLAGGPTLGRDRTEQQSKEKNRRDESSHARKDKHNR